MVIHGGSMTTSGADECFIDCCCLCVDGCSMHLHTRSEPLQVPPSLTETIDKAVTERGHRVHPLCICCNNGIQFRRQKSDPVLLERIESGRAALKVIRIL